MAKEFVKAHLSPATYSDQKQIKFPDATVGETLAYGKTWHVNVSATASGTIYVYLLPFLEVPLATWDGENTWQFFSDPNMSGASWMGEQGIYAFRCLGQSVTAYNTTAEIYKQGNATAAVLRSCLDRHRVVRSLTSADGTLRDYRETAMFVDGLPMTTLDISSNSKHPYFGKASDGCYLVNRNYGGFQWIFRNSNLNKANTTFYRSNTVTGSTTATEATSEKTYLMLPRSGPSAMGSSAPAVVVKTDSQGNLSPAYGTVKELIGTPGEYLGVSGLLGNNYGVGVIAFTGLSAETSFMLKIKHLYEFLLKPNSPYTPLTTASWPLVPWVEDVIRKQLEDKPDAFDSSANFLGAILNGIKKIWPYVAPLVAKGAAKISELAAESVAKRNRPQKPSRPPPKRPAQ